MIYVNTQIPIEELSKEQAYIEEGRRISVQKEWFYSHKEVLKEKHRLWAKLNKDHLAIYREDNRERIRESYNKCLLKKKKQIDNQ